MEFRNRLPRQLARQKQPIDIPTFTETIVVITNVPLSRFESNHIRHPLRI